MFQQTYRSFSEFYHNSDYGQFPHENRSGGSVPVHLIKAEQSAIDFVDPPTPELLLVVGLQADIPFRMDLGDGWTKDGRYRTQDLVFCPAETAIRHNCGGEHKILFCGFPMEKVASLLEEEGLNLSVFNPLHGPVFRDEIIRAAVLQMWLEGGRCDRASSLIIDGLYQVVLAQLLRRAEATVSAHTERFSGLTMARLDAYIETHCQEKLTIRDLAKVVGCSPFYFARSFKQTTGQSPHQYLIDRQISQVCKQITAGRLPLARIAIECGFSDQAHMTRIFKKRLGMTPGQYRRDIRV
jgi:AraC family transcriptional regulator